MNDDRGLAPMAHRKTFKDLLIYLGASRSVTGATISILNEIEFQSESVT